MITFTGRVSASREDSDAGIFDEGIAPAISEEKSAADESLAGGRKRAEKVIMTCQAGREYSVLHNKHRT